MKILGLNMMLVNKGRKSFVLCLCVILTASMWYWEKTKIIPQYSMVFYEMGLSCGDKCGQNKQLRYFQKAVHYNTQFSDDRYAAKLSDAHYRSALIYEEKGDYGKAVESFVQSIEIDQRNALAYYKFGLFHSQRGSYEYARRYFLRCLSLKNGCPDETYYHLALIYDQNKEYDLAIPCYLTMAWVHPEYAAKVSPRLAELYYFLNREDAMLHAVYMLRQRDNNDFADQLEQNFKAIQASKSGIK